MATPALIQFAQHSYESRAAPASVQRLQNMYLEANPGEAKNPTSLIGTPGLKLWTTVGDGPIRGLHAMGNKLYAVSDDEMYEIDSSKSASLLGSVNGTGNVRMADSGVHVITATGANTYASKTDEHVVLSEGGFNGAAYQDGYGIFTRKSSQDFYITNLDDMKTISSTDFSQADALGDNNQGCVSDHRELFIFKEKTIEVFYNSGNVDFPFTRTGSGFIERGCRSPGSIAKEDNTVFWLGDDLAVYSAAGYRPEKISTPPIEKLIASESNQGSGEAFTYRQEGHVFYVLSFPSLTICYDASTGRWHERSTFGKGRWSANSHVFQFEKNLVGDFENGNIYELDLDTYTDNGTAIIREVVSPPVHNRGSLLSVSELYVDMEMGVGIATGQGSDPTLMLDWTDDFGNTWSNQVDAGAGKIGEYTRRATWNRLGASRQRSFRLQLSDPVRAHILSAYVRAEAYG